MKLRGSINSNQTKQCVVVVVFCGIGAWGLWGWGSDGAGCGGGAVDGGGGS